MRDMLTNFALLMELARVDPEKLSRALETDPSLISRWRTGSRRPNARWRRKLADYFLDACGNEVRTLLAEAVRRNGRIVGAPGGAAFFVPERALT